MFNGTHGSPHYRCLCFHFTSSGVKTLGSAGGGEHESAASWVVKMKNLEEEKKKAKKKVSQNN